MISPASAPSANSFEPGAGGEHKAARGFSPTVTHSTHLLVDRRLDMAVRDFVQRERAAVVEHVTRERALSRKGRS